jgi:hypothetical protein
MTPPRQVVIRRNITKRSFEEEFLALLKKSGVAYDAERLFAA